jgi:hypothetical protein
MMNNIAPMRRTHFTNTFGQLFIARYAPKTEELNGSEDGADVRRNA